MRKRITVLTITFLALVGLSLAAEARTEDLKPLGNQSTVLGCGEQDGVTPEESQSTLRANCSRLSAMPSPSDLAIFLPVMLKGSGIESPAPEPPPGEYGDTFPEANPLTLGTCPAAVHDRYAEVGPDGNKYRSWHPIVVPIDPNGSDGPKCTFAHEHGDPPHPDGPQPPFGYISKLNGSVGMIAAHPGYKCFTHYSNGNNGWGYPELDYGGLPIDFTVCVHQGTSGAGRLSVRFHDFWFWSNYQGRETLVTAMADTGSAVALCGSNEQNGEAEPGRFLVAHGCNIYEQWIFGVNVGDVWFSNGSDFAVTNPVTHVDGGPVTGTVEVTSCDPFTSCAIHGPMGDAGTFYLGNMRTIHEPDWEWLNAGGAETFCTDAYGNRAGCGVGTVEQRVAPVTLSNQAARILDRTENSKGFEEHQDMLGTLGVPGGN